MNARVLIADDEAGIRSFIAEVLGDDGHRVTQAADGQMAAALLEEQSFHLMITDLRMPKMDGLELLARARKTAPEMEVIVLTAFGTVDSAVEAMRLGAFDYLKKPLSGPEELSLLVRRALERKRLKDLGRHSSALNHPDFVTRDPSMAPVVEQLNKVAATPATVLLLGESGTGKEVAARLVHRQSDRRKAPFIAVNCAAISAELVESEMFGHEKGAFTGATERRQGRFELADSGTLFLDEVSELPLGLQAKLLRVLQEQCFERVGGGRTIQVDVRIVAASNRDLKAQIKAGSFRQDLYHRLAVFPIRLPPLRDRPGDIVPLAEHLLVRIGRELGRTDLALGRAADEKLRAYHWPGNVRELGNVLERAAIMSDVPERGPSIIGPEHILTETEPDEDSGAWDGTLKDIELRAIKHALAATGGHRKMTAQKLGIGLRTLYEKLKEYGLNK